EGGSQMMIQNLAEVIQKNEYLITRELVGEIRKMPEVRHYRNIMDDVLFDNVHNVLYHVYKRLPHWHRHHASKSTVFSFYFDLGRQRCREKVPLQETIRVLFSIKKGICRCISERRALDKGFTLDQLAEFFSLVNHFFDRVAHAVISGYLEATSTKEGVGRKRMQ
ncbi:MAG TPA: hypothetical protein PK314_05550, partial [Deltaproteobacteria bacterium]|nr:hypothetical protein [Deltaproteobacteria bacterium]